MKLLRTLALLLSFSCLFGLIAPPAQAANVNNFKIQDYKIDYYLDKNAENRSTLKTVETIQAVFPQSNQNHGIERAVPLSFDDHSTRLNVDSVTDASGKSLEYTTYDSNGNSVIRIGSASTYVHGLQTYKITYTQHDVTKFYQDLDRDEFYWDTNGIDWAVPISKLTVQLHVSNNLTSSLNDNAACYFGKSGSTDRCEITRTNNGYVAQVQSLNARENMTIAVGFKKNTFSPYQPSLFEILSRIWFFVQVFLVIAAVALMIWILVRYSRKSNRTGELSVIVPEYIPPKNSSVSVAGSIANKPTTVFTAQLIDFAVRHYIKIYQTSEKSLFKRANFELEIIKDISDLKEEEKELFRDLFDNPVVGSKLDMASLRNNYSVSAKLYDNSNKVNKSIKNEYALRATVPEQSRWFKIFGVILLVASFILFSPVLLIPAITALICGYTLKPLTDQGLALSRYLKGLEMYIKVAETERLKMLQSPEGAAKLDTPIDTNDQRQLIKLYERVLPYAILFGQEKQWNNQLGLYYQSANQSPSWYSGNNGVFNAAVFAGAMSSFSTTAAYSNPSSSSSGGSGGGGSSGGGGGGGGGGGW